MRSKSKSTSRKQHKSKLTSRTKFRSFNLSSNKKNVSRKSKSKLQKKLKSNSKRLTRRRKQKTKSQHGGECEYLKVHGMTLPDLKIPDQFALISENCQPGTGLGEPVLDGHPNISNS